MSGLAADFESRSNSSSREALPDVDDQEDHAHDEIARMNEIYPEQTGKGERPLGRKVDLKASVRNKKGKSEMASRLSAEIPAMRHKFSVEFNHIRGIKC